MSETSMDADRHTLPRRRFLRDSALAIGASSLAVTVPFSSSASAHGAGSLSPLLRGLNLQTPASLDAYAPVALDAAQLTTLKAAIDRILPSDDLGPGAVDAGVFVYIDQTLAASDEAVLALYQQGLAALDTAAGSGGFAGLSAADQDALLTKVEAGSVADVPDGFFITLLTHTRQGMFGDPIHGGNRDFVGWDLIGYPGIKLLWTEADQKIGATIAPLHISVTQFRGEDK